MNNGGNFDEFSLSSPLPTSPDMYQRDVVSILALDYVGIRSKRSLGLPAFDNRNALVGFYKYDNQIGQPLYYAVQELEGDLTSEDRDYLYGLISGGNSLLVSAEKTGDFAQDLNNLRERAFLKHFSSSSA